jgi:hypothetical protein
VRELLTLRQPKPDTLFLLVMTALEAGGHMALAVTALGLLAAATSAGGAIGAILPRPAQGPA